MADLNVNSIGDASGGTTATVNGFTPSVSNMAGRNRIINGGFDVWQRSAGPVTGGGYTTVDRWLFPSSGEASQRVTNDRDSSFPFALQVTADSTGYGIIAQRIEDVRTLSGGTATLSFWAKSPTTGVFRCFIEQNFGSGGSANVTILDNASQFSINAANTWQQFTLTVTMPSVSGKTIGASNFVNVGMGPNSGTANRVMTFSEVQLEAGSVATPFEHRQYGQELALCQRYYYEVAVRSRQFTTAAGQYIRPIIVFPSTMTYAPTFVWVLITEGGITYNGGNDQSDSSSYGIDMRSTGTSSSAYCYGTAKFSAEL